MGVFPSFIAMLELDLKASNMPGQWTAEPRLRPLTWEFEEGIPLNHIPDRDWRTTMLAQTDSAAESDPQTPIGGF